MASTSSPPNMDDIVKAIDTLINLLSTLSPERTAAAHEPLITQRANHLISQLQTTFNSPVDQAKTIPTSPATPRATTPISPQPASPVSRTNSSTKEHPSDPPTSNALKRRSESPLQSHPQIKRPCTPPPSLAKASTTDIPTPEPVLEPTPPPPSPATTNPLAALFAERAARHEARSREAQLQARASALAERKARQEAIVADPTKAEQRKHALAMKEKMDKEKTQRELVKRRIEEDRKERMERNEQARLRREALAVAGKVGEAKKVVVVGGEIRVLGEGVKGRGRDAVGGFADEGDDDEEEHGEGEEEDGDGEWDGKEDGGDGEW